MTTDKQQQSVNTDDLDETVFISDNLPFLKSLDTESIDLVCIDPPFGKRQTFTGELIEPLTDEEKRIERELMDSWGAYDPTTAYELGLEYPDQTGTTAKFDDIWNFRVRVYEDWLKELKGICTGAYWLIQATRHTHSDAIAAYIAFMVERMLEIRRILKPTGSVYLHCDHEANAYLRQMMDAIFGQRNFRNEIIWESTNRGHKGSQHKPKFFSRNTHTILFYAKSNSNTLNIDAVLQPYEEGYEEKTYNFEDSKGRYSRESPFRRKSAGPRPNLCYEYKGFNAPVPTGWAVSLERLKQLDENGDIEIIGNRIYRKIRPRGGKRISNLWPYDGIGGALGAERTGYPTQKPQALAKRIIEAGSNPGDMVLDCFAGCAYVPVAAQITSRRWIACDMSPRAWTVVRRQFHKHPELGIVTEGEIATDNGGLQVEPQLETANRIIKVRGPGELPQRTNQDKPIPIKVSMLPPIQYKQSPVETSQQIWNAFIQEWGSQCWYCGAEKIPDRRELHLDHVEPNKRDGTNDDCWNRAIACAICNSNKADRLTPEETIKLAFEQGLIETESLKREAIQKFRRRHEWARLRWETKIKPNRMM